MLGPNGRSVVGPCHEPVLRSVKPSTAFVSCDGFSLAAGLTDTDAQGALVKSKMVAVADSTVALIESSRYGRVYQGPFARADQLAHIFSDDAVDPDWVNLVQDASIALTLCNPSL
jgi:DeoR/GlpR family transcriptional regulator of sugar metabolism